MTPIPDWPFLVDDFPVVMYEAGRKNPTPLPFHVVLDNRGREPIPVAFAYSRQVAKAIAIDLSRRHEEERLPAMDG